MILLPHGQETLTGSGQGKHGPEWQRIRQRWVLLECAHTSYEHGATSVKKSTTRVIRAQNMRLARSTLRLQRSLQSRGGSVQEMRFLDGTLPASRRISTEYLDWISTEYLDWFSTECLDWLSMEYLDWISTECLDWISMEYING